MLSITTEHLKLLADAQLAEFINQCKKSLRNHFPKETRQLNESVLFDYILKTVEHLHAVGFVYSGDITNAVHFRFQLEYGNNQLKVPMDLETEFNSPYVSIEKKLEILEQVLIFGAS